MLFRSVSQSRYRAFKNQKTSWLSREALYLGVYAGLLSVVCGLLFIQTAPFVVFFVCAATFAAGLYGIYAQSMIYRVSCPSVMG